MRSCRSWWSSRAGQAARLRCRQSRRVRARLCRLDLWRPRSGRARDPPRGRWARLSRRPWRSFRSRRASRPLARFAWRCRLSYSVGLQRLAEQDPEPVRACLLVVLVLGEVAGQECGQPHRPFRGGAVVGSAAPPGPGRDLRPHPSRGDASRFRRSLHQHRRLGGNPAPGSSEHHDGRFEIIRWTEARPHQMPGEASVVPFAKAVA